VSLREVAIGAVVHYTLSDADAQLINARRRTAAQIQDAILSDAWSMGAQPHMGTDVSAGEVFAAVVVRAWPGERANVQVLLDGTDVHWARSVRRGDAGERGAWQWPSLAATFHEHVPRGPDALETEQ
jgi:hypothetical protein